MLQPLMRSCNADVVDTKQKINGHLYHALMTGDKKKVADLCQRIPDHALHVITVNDDTVLHMATYAKEATLVEKLLDELPDHHVDKLTRQNRVGNTILHETATSNHAVAVADKLLKRAPGLLGMRNHNGETALFRAARYGKTDMFNTLAAKVSAYDEDSLQFYVQRSDKTTILHIAILSEHFELARQIAFEYKHLIGEKDCDGMTSLQLLSCNPSAFKQEPEDGFIKLAKSCCSKAWWEKVQSQKHKYKSAVDLAKLLARNDTSWEVTYSSIDQSKPKIHRYGEMGGQEGLSLSARIPERMDDVGETPLILATKSGIVEIVEEILRLYPQAVEHVDDEGRNVLHVAIKYRELKIFELVKKMEVPMKRLVRKIDNDGNSILHTVGIKRKDFVSERMEGPAFLLQEELLWFERVEKITPPHFLNHQNNQKLSAEGFFITANSELRSTAKDWMKSTAEGSSVVAVLIATVAFAAAYTVPGGPNQSTGVPVLKIKGDLYYALMTGDKKRVAELCQKIQDHALHIITVKDDTVLHMATYAKEAALVEKLLDELPDHHLNKLTRQNRVGNTILHKTATSNHAVAIADKLLKRAPGLLGMRNHNGETALFRAVRYGKPDMFKFLAAKVSGYDEAGLQFYVQRSDKTTILHMAILSRHFAKSCGNSAWKEKVQKQKQQYKSAVELAEFLVRKDTSWELTYPSIDRSKPKIHKYGEKGGQERQEVLLSNRILDQMEGVGETPLILATKSGCVEIVEQILKLYPQAVEHIDDDGRNVLHVAIKYRQLNIFYLVTGMEVPMKRLARRIDNDGNSILHTVALKRKDFVSDEKMEGPAFLLQEELLWFENAARGKSHSIPFPESSEQYEAHCRRVFHYCKS
ncbi:unnamed protein product [Dovyalis caffra]|uniref:PGG domain-containing protein n=1 Tax=Dovyalis caffra TaxID=77055 RepID=A0AAV1SJ36_9ROSI|nr:unnamed protein product [Dovyalis caffra]